MSEHLGPSFHEAKSLLKSWVIQLVNKFLTYYGTKNSHYYGHNSRSLDLILNEINSVQVKRFEVLVSVKVSMSFLRKVKTPKSNIDIKLYHFFKDVSI